MNLFEWFLVGLVAYVSLAAFVIRRVWLKNTAAYAALEEEWAEHPENRNAA